MISDVNERDAPARAAHYDVCIAGAGVAGIVLARRLASWKRRVLLLEAGGLDYSDISQDSYRGAIIGHSYHDLDVARLRYLGGTSNHWGGWCRPLDDYDFERRGHIVASGWPINRSDIDSYLPEAFDILGIPAVPEDRPLAGSDGLLKEVFFHIPNEDNPNEPVRFRLKYLDALASSHAIDLLLNANLVDIVLKDDGRGVAAFKFRGYSDGAPLHTATADSYVLALGGIENPRALLNANKQEARGLGNESELVGRHFMEHPTYILGYYVLETEKQLFGQERVFLAPMPALMRRKGIANAGFRFEPIVETSEMSLTNRAKELARDVICANDVIADLARSIRPVNCRTPISGAGSFRVSAEQSPNPDSRVTLGDKKDRFGLNRVVLDWQLTRLDQRTVRIGALEVAKYLARNNIGRIKLFDWVLEDQASFPEIEEGDEVGGFHHMGTTRMGESKNDGVVDRNCRVFGVGNLYVAGSSVFRTAGHANPTLSIVQLSLRLGDHLARQ